jgi:SNF2 family DNA or RNA helicase
LASRSYHLLANPIGSGKTRTALAAVQALYQAGDIEQIIVVCAKSLKHSVWGEELTLHFPDLEYQVLEGTPKQRKKFYAKWESSPSPVLIMHYFQLVSKDSYEFLLDILNNKKTAVIVDEAHNLKDPGTKQSKRFAEARMVMSRVYLVTGTPLMNNSTELHTLISLMNPLLLGHIRYFNRKYCIIERFPVTVRGRKRWIEKPMGWRKDKLKSLQDIVSKLMTQRPLDTSRLPGLTKSKRYVELGKEQRKVYNRASYEGILIAHDVERILDNPLTRLTAMRMITSGRHTEESAKKDELEGILEEAEAQGHNCIVYSPYATTVNRLYEHFKDKHTCYMAVGGLSEKELGSRLNKFKTDGGVLFMTAVGSEGLRLETASLVVVYDLTWNPARLDQLIGRAWRLGQKNDVHVVLLLAENTVDEKIWTLIQTKRDLMETVEAMSREELFTFIAEEGLLGT